MPAATTKELRDRVRAPLGDAIEPSSTALGNWYATALFRGPQMALFVDEATLLPVLVPLAPAKSLAERFPDHVEAVLNALGTDPRFVAAEVAATVDALWATPKLAIPLAIHQWSRGLGFGNT